MAKNTSGPCIDGCMEFMQTNLPFLPSGWTLARGMKYLFKLAMFILIPGLHQLARKHSILGGMIFVGYLVTKIVIADHPFDFVEERYLETGPYHKLANVFQLFSWVLMLLDIKNLESRVLTFRVLLPIACFIGFHLIPLHGYRDFYLFVEQQHGYRDFHLFVEQENYACPVFCRGDIVKFKPRNPVNDPFGVGDYVVIRGKPKQPYISRILLGPVNEKERCPIHYYNWIDSKEKELLCPPVDEYDKYKFLILGGDETAFHLRDGLKNSVISDFEILGVEPEKIGNLHEYYVWSEEVTGRLGYVLLDIYRWTNINLFDLTKSGP
jgi:hypothetical protein